MDLSEHSALYRPAVLLARLPRKVCLCFRTHSRGSRRATSRVVAVSRCQPRESPCRPRAPRTCGTTAARCPRLKPCYLVALLESAAQRAAVACPGDEQGRRPGGEMLTRVPFWGAKKTFCSSRSSNMVVGKTTEKGEKATLRKKSWKKPIKPAPHRWFWASTFRTRWAGALGSTQRFTVTPGGLLA